MTHVRLGVALSVESGFIAIHEAGRLFFLWETIVYNLCGGEYLMNWKQI
jgi:hypothetical protein